MMKQPLTLQKQRGLALVEAAITLPLLLFVWFGAVEITNAFIQHTTLTKSTRDAARFLAYEVVNTAKAYDLNAGLQDDAKNLVVHGNIGGNGPPLLPGLAVGQVTINGNAATRNVTVTVAYPYTGIFGAAIPAFGYRGDISTAFNLGATVTMRATR